MEEIDPTAAATTGARPVLDLDRAASDIARTVNGLASDWLAGRSTDGFRHFGAGIAEIEAAMSAVEPTARQSVWNMQPIFSFDPASANARLNDDTRRRSVDLRLVTSPHSRDLYPLITSEIPWVRFGPARAQFILIDGITAIVGGPLSEHGYPTAWLATRADIVTAVRSIWTETWQRSIAGVPDGTAPPFTVRQCRVARRLTLGAKDATIARELGVSVRTVAADVAHLMHTLGAGSRAEAALMLVGRSRRLDLERLRPR